MRATGTDAYYISTSDFHCSEYLGDYFKCVEFMTGFDGSAGEAVITMSDAGLWTDGRYFIQAAAQLEGTGIKLYKSGMDGVLRADEYIKENLKKGQTLGCDGRTVSAEWAQNMEKSFEISGAILNGGLDLIGDIWEDRPKLEFGPAMLLDASYAGETREKKIEKLKGFMNKYRADFIVLTSLDEIAWLLNIRGCDIHCNPVVMSYLAAHNDKLLLFADKGAFAGKAAQELAKAGVYFRDYDGIYEFLRSVPSESRVILDKNTANSAIADSVQAGAKILDMASPVIFWKAVKNEVEIKNIKQAHIKDGAAVVKFIYWLKKNAGKIDITELGAIERLEKLRSENPGYMGPSFDAIAAYGGHGAIVHYSPTKETDAKIEPGGLLLMDTGGHYINGTTDVTRTILIGDDATREQKKFYTAVLRGCLNLAGAKFMHGCAGVSLDILARKPLWDMGCDYRHGTGHGVGYFLNVHEPPNAFRFSVSKKAGRDAVLEAGMVTSDEPGIYFEGRYGIRLENLILCVKREKTEFGQFMGFEHLTFVPFDRNLIDVSLMNEEEKGLLNGYHKQVYEKISPFLTFEERRWLERECGEIH